MNAKKKLRYITEENSFLKANNIEKKDHYVKINELNTTVRVQSIGQGEPLLFIPGGPCTGTVWTQLAALLPQYQCLLLDRPGTGLSISISYKQLDNAQLTAIITKTIKQVLNYFNFDQVVLVGSSFGGYWALKHAIHCPGQVKKLVIEGCPAFIEGFIIPPFMKMMTRPLMKWLIPMIPTTLSFSRKLLMDMGHTSDVVNHHVPAEYYRWYISMCNDSNTVRNDLIVINKAMKGGQVDPQHYLRDTELSKITHPTLWLWGRNDPFGGEETGTRINSVMKDSRILFFEHGGHLPWLDDPAMHANLLNDFLKELS